MEDTTTQEAKKTILSLFTGWLKKNFSGFIVGFCLGIIACIIYILNMGE